MLTDRRGKALSLCSALAIATVLAAAPQAARAQSAGPSGSFQGTGTVVAGSAVVSTGTNTTTVTVGSPQAVINWTPFDQSTSPGTPINFQPAGTTATFQSSNQFAVLNRILPADASRPVQFNGTVISQIQNSTLTSPGGTVYFYSPGGIIIGATAAFNVGNLGLTTSPVTIDANGNWYNSVTTPIAGNQVQFGQAASGSSVQIQPGAQITASAEDSYIAIFSPYIVQNGTINVNGQASLVAAEAGTLTFNPFSGSTTGLIDIEVSIGSDGQNGVGIVHGGGTTGPGSSGAGDLHRVYMVAVPKSALLSMVFERGSSVGFDVAGAANVQGNAVVLSAGQTLRGDAFKSASRKEGGNIVINDSNSGLSGTGIDFTSRVTAVATDNLTVDVLRQTKFASDAFLVAEELVQVAVGTIAGEAAGNLSVAGKLVLDNTFGLTTPASRDSGSAQFFASGGASASVGGDMEVRSIATTDRNADGVATAGTAQVNLNDGQLTVGGQLRALAIASTTSASTPLAAQGGNAQINLSGFSSVTVGSVTRVVSDGSGKGANVTGGVSSLTVQQGSTFTTDQLNVSADASAVNNGPAATAGVANGGQATISVSGATSVLNVSAANSVGNSSFGELDFLSAEAFAGHTNAAGGTGGAAQGGNASFNVSGGAVANLPVNPGPLGGPRMIARAYGGNVLGNGGTGGAATGGVVSLNIDGGTLNSGNNLLPSSFAQGGSAGTGATGTVNGGHAFGGQRNVSIVNGTLNGSFAGGGPGAQGGNGSPTGTGGNGTGGTANFFMDNATINATSDSSGAARVLAFTQNAGGTGMIGGNTSGGVVNVTIQNNSVINANGAGAAVGFGSNNYAFDATTAGAVSSGDSAAGTVNVSVLNSAINAGQFDIYAQAFSGNFATAGGAGANARTGNATGGTAQLFLNGATITAPIVSVQASALAGGSTDINAVNGGNATGGTAQIFARSPASTINASGGLTVEASAEGAAISGPGNGGSGTGGFASVRADTGGSLTINGDTVLEANGTGQSASALGRGGDGISGFSEVAGISGSLTFNGNLGVHTTGTGGNGPAAGNASATFQVDRPNAILRAQNGGVTVTGATAVSANSIGGNGLLGGAGGNAAAGFAIVDAQNNATGPSTVSLQGLSVSANGSGGSGGTGLSGAAGGAGGSGTGGNTQVFGNAANGALAVAGQSFLVAEAFGGSGGQGGANGGIGGAGGAATGGGIQFGTRSGNDIGSVNTGSATFAGVTASATATGGVGGNGGAGSVTGNGGAGGAASGGRTTLLVRGSPVRIQGLVSLESDALGGNGGSGAVSGAGGSATVGAGGGAVVAVTSRFQYPDQRGLLEAGDIDATALAIGGTGSVAGIGRVLDAPLQFQVDRADVSIESLSMLASGQRVADAGPSTVSIANGVVNVTDTLSISTPGDLSISLDTATVNVANLSLSAGNFVLPAVRPATLGTFNVSQNLTIHSGLDFRAYANFDVAGDGFFDIDGSVETGDLAFDGDFGLLAGGSVTTGSILAGGLIEIDAVGPVALGNLTAGQSIDVESDAALAVGNVVAGHGAFFEAGGTLLAGNITAGSDPNDPVFSIGLVAGGNIAAGNLTGVNGVGFLSRTGSIAAGNVTAGRSVLALARTGVSFGNVTTGVTANDFLYIANSSMEPLGGPIDNFNPAPIFAATPVALTGPITITGTVSTGNLVAATTGALSIGAGTTPATINLPGRLNLVVGGPLALGNVTATDIRLQSGSTITGGALTSREGVTVLGAGTVTLGNLSAGIVNPTTSQVPREVRVASTGGAVTVGTVASAGDVRIDAVGGGLTAGAITAGDDVLLLARDSVAVGGITAGTADGRITIANSAMRSFGDTNDADPDAVFNATPIPVTGAITIGGPVTGTVFRAAGTGDFTAGTMTLGESLRVDRAALLQVNGAWVAPTINLASQRIAFGTASGAGIGGTGTTSLTLRALTSGQTAVLGGTTAGSGYTLTQADFGRIRSTNLTIQVDSQGVSGSSGASTASTSTTSSSSGPDLEIRDLTLTGSAGGGHASTTITTPGRARVTGDLLLTQAGVTDTLTVNATSRLEIVLPEGSIAIAGAGGALAGTLTLSSNNLVAGTLDILQQVMADPEAAGLVDALKTPASTTPNLNGYIRAEGVRLLSNANILLQNSGTARDFAGVTVGGGGLIIGRITPASSGGTGGNTGGTGGSGTTGFSFTGMLATANEVLMFQFQVDANAEITLRTYSYAGGTNAAGQVIPAGGFDPILALFDAAGALIGQNDDGGSNVPADPTTGSRYDTFFQPPAPLAAGTYTVTVSAYPNFAVGPNLSNGFQGNGSLGGRTPNFAFDVLGATSATGSGNLAPTGPSGPLNVIGFGRQLGANGQVITNNAFFPTIDFGRTGENPLEYTATSQFNACIVGGECLGPSLEDLAPVDSIASAISVVTAATLDDSPSAPAADDADEGDDGSSEEAEEEDDSDPGASAITPPAPLINTRRLNPNVDVVEPVSGGGNPALLGSAVEENIVEGDNP